MAFALRCPVCRKAFRYNALEPHPRFCPLEGCGADIGGPEEDDNVIAMPAFLSAKTKATDDVYRQIESSSERRAELAARDAGVPVSEMAGLKVTDLRPTMRAGDIAAVPVQNAVTQQMDAMTARGMPVGFGGGVNAEGLAGQVRTGPYPNAGANAIASIQRLNGVG